MKYKIKIKTIKQKINKKLKKYLKLKEKVRVYSWETEIKD